MKRNDIFLLIGILTVALGIFAGYTLFFHSSGDSITISVDGTVTHTLSLQENITLAIEGNQGGTNTLEIKNGAASITHADCPDKLCVHQKEIKNQGETLVCLPHKVIITVISEKESEFDGISQ